MTLCTYEKPVCCGGTVLGLALGLALGLVLAFATARLRPQQAIPASRTMPRLVRHTRLLGCSLRVVTHADTNFQPPHQLRSHTERRTDWRADRQNMPRLI